MTTEDLLPVTAVKERGWTDSLVKRFLGEPDECRTNPRYRSAAPMRLYRVGRVEEAEGTLAWLDAKAKADVRKRAARDGATRKRAALLDWASSVEVRLIQIDRSALLDAAIESYNAYASWRGEFDSWASRTSDTAFLSRIQVNWLRHEAGDYEDLLVDLAGKVGADDAYLEIKCRVLDAIADAYPYLASEARRQKKQALEVADVPFA